MNTDISFQIDKYLITESFGNADYDFFFDRGVNLPADVDKQVPDAVTRDPSTSFHQISR